VRTATDVLQALRSGRAVAGIVPRSVLRHAADRAQFGATRIPFDGIFAQTAYAAGRPAGEQVVRWLASAAGRARFAAAGFGRPGPDARPIDCPADISKPCRERPGP
jgi:ABC-type amino acid transport substrate-binding protein